MKSRLVQVADIGVTFYSTCALYYVGIVRERVMARRLIVALMSVAILIGFVSCDLSTAMRAMGNNIAGTNPGKVNRVNETIDAIWGEDGSGGSTLVSETTTIGNIDMAAWTGDVTAYLTPFADESDFLDLASSISAAASTTQGKNALNADLSKPLTDDDQIEATKGSATIVTNMILNAFNTAGDSSWQGRVTKDNIEAYLEEVIKPSEDDTESMPYYEIMKSAILGVVDMADSTSEVSKGDMVIMQTLFTVVEQVGPQFFTGDSDPETGFPAIKEDISLDTIDTDSLITYANGAVKIVDSISPSTKFGNIGVSSLLSELISQLQSSDEGGSN